MSRESAAFLHVLVVDANSASRADTTQQLELCNYKVISVSSLDENLSQLRALGGASLSAAELPRVDVALIEHAPPEASAQAVIQHLLSSSLNSPIIITSLFDDRQGVLECLYWGADDYLIRPLRLNELGNIWVHLWRRVHPPPGLIREKAQPPALAALGLQTIPQGQDGCSLRSGENGHLMSNEGSNPSDGDPAKRCGPDSNLASCMRDSLPGSGLRSTTGPAEKTEQGRCESQQPRNGAGSSQQLVGSDHGSNQPAEVHDQGRVWQEHEPADPQACPALDADFHDQQPDVEELDCSKQGFRAWMPPPSSRSVPQPPLSRKRSAPGAEPEAPATAHADGQEALPGNASQLVQNNSMSAMHRPGGHALHSRTKQCLRSGQAASSHASGTWDSAFPSYTQLARQQSQRQSGSRVLSLTHDIAESLGATDKAAQETPAQGSGREALAQESWQDSSHLQAFAAGLAAATASLGSLPLAQPNRSNAQWDSAAPSRLRASEAPQDHAADLAARHQHDLQRYSFHAPTMPEHERVHDRHLGLSAPHSIGPSAAHAHSMEGRAQGGPWDWHAWEQGQRDQAEYEYLHSLWQQHLKQSITLATEKQPQQDAQPHHHQMQAGFEEGHHRTGRHSRDDRGCGGLEAMLWQAMSHQRQQQPPHLQQQQQQQHYKADHAARPSSSQAQARAPEPAKDLPLMPQFPWPGMDAASPEAQAFVAAYASYFSQAAGSANSCPPMGSVAEQAQRSEETRAGDSRSHLQPWNSCTWGSRSSGHASGSIPSAQVQGLKDQPQSGRRSSFGERSAFQRPADVSQDAGRSKASEGCKPSRRGSVELTAAANGHRRSVDSQRPRTESSGKDLTWESSSSHSVPRSSAGPLITSPSPNLLTDATAKAAPSEPASASQEPRERRAAALQRYKQKRKNLCHTRKIRYEMRKQLAQARPRVRGQFVKTALQPRGCSNTISQTASPAAISCLATQDSLPPSQGDAGASDIEELEDAEDEDSDEDTQHEVHVARQDSEHGPSRAAPQKPSMADGQAVMSAGW